MNPGRIVLPLRSRRRVLGPTKVFATKEFVHADDLRTAFGRFADFLDSTRQIVRGVLSATHLNQANSKFVRHESYRNTRTKEFNAEALENRTRKEEVL